MSLLHANEILHRVGDLLSRFWSGSKVVAKILLAIAFLTSVAFLAAMLWPLRDVLPPWAWGLIGASLLAVAAIFLIVKGIPWYRERRFVRQNRREIAAAPTAPGSVTFGAMESTIVGAKRRVLDAPWEGAKTAIIYRIPWFLVLGDEAADTTSLLRAASAGSPFPSPPPAPGSPWSFWFFKNAVCVQTAPSFIADVTDRANRTTWYRALLLLRRHRPKVPVNGFVIVVSVPSLMGPPDAVREYSLRIRQMLDEAIKFAQVKAPAYILVSQCDKLTGFAEFVSPLGGEVAQQAFGHRYEAGAAAEAAIQRMAQIHDEVAERLHAVRLALLREPANQSRRRGIYQFVEAFAKLRGNLDLFVKGIFEDNGLQRAPQPRGLYFVGSTDHPALLDDVFKRFLPVDQPLAMATVRQSATRLAAAIALALGVSAGSIYLASEIVGIDPEQRALIAEAKGLCEGPGDGTIDRLIGCEQKLAAVERTLDGSLGSFGLSRAGREFAALRDGFLGQFEQAVVAPLDAAAASRVELGTASIEDYVGGLQRYALLRACAESSRLCRTSDETSHSIFRAEALPALAAAAPRLAPAYAGYARWRGADASLAQAQNVAGHLRQQYQKRRPAIEDLVAWAARHHAPVRVSDFWNRPAVAAAPVGRTREDESVPAAFTARAWTGGIRLLFDLLGQAVPDAQAAMSDLRGAYMQRYGQVWRGFVTQFNGGATVWSGLGPGLVATLLEPESNPYRRLWRAIETELVTVLPTGDRPRWLQALQNTIQRDQTLAQSLADRMLAALGRDSDGRASYDIVADLFSNNGVGVGPGRAFNELWDATKPGVAEGEAPLSPTDLEGWSAVRAPARQVFALLLDRAAWFVQTQWEAGPLTAVQRLAPAERVQRLAGDRGLVAEFANAWLSPFFSDRGVRPKRIFESEFPLAPDFMGFMSDQAAAAPRATEPFHAATVTIQQPTRFGAWAAEGPGGTTVEVECRTGTSRVSSQGGERRASIYWAPGACIEVRVRVALPDWIQQEMPAAGQMSIARVYRGNRNLLDFIAAFRNGRVSIPLAEFEPVFSPADWARVRPRLLSFQAEPVTIDLAVEPTEALRGFSDRPTAGAPVPRLIVRLTYFQR